MKIEADDKEVQDIFSLGYFKIPRFQRPYSWDADEVESFWNDIINEKTENYFIGSMVVYQTKKPYFGIVDGQQRLTTITLLLSVIRNGFIKLGEDNLAKGVHKYVEKANIDNENEFVLNAETSFPYLQDHIQSYEGFKIDCNAGVEEQKLERAFDLLSEKVERYIPELECLSNIQQSLFTNHDSNPIQRLKELRDKILSLKLVFIQLDNEDDAYLIFETLNARGRDLTTADLIKNLILKKVKSKSATLDQAKESWNMLVKQFDEAKDGKILDTFLLHYWLSNHGYTTEKKLFSEVKEFIGENGEKAKNLVNNLARASILYNKTVDPNFCKWKKEDFPIRDSLIALNSFKVKQQSSMVLSLLNSHQKGVLSHKNLTRALLKIEHFHFCFNTITNQRSSGSIPTKYSKIAIQLSESKNNEQAQLPLNELHRFLTSKFPDREEFIIKFGELEYLNNRTKNRAAIVYALSKLIKPNEGALPVNYETLTIEHLIPQSKITSASDELEIASIGNLILVDGKVNSEELCDKEAPEKIKYLDEIGYPIVSNFLCRGSFEFETIKERKVKIANAVYNKMRDIVFSR